MNVVLSYALLTIVDSSTEVQIGMYIVDISVVGQASFQRNMLCLCYEHDVRPSVCLSV